MYPKMKDPLLLKEENRLERVQTQETLGRWRVLGVEVKKLGLVAAPMVAVQLSQYMVQFVSLTMVGHLDELSLASTALATSLTSVTGCCFMVGMASALETQCGQAYGAKQYQKLGTQTYTAIFALIMVCIPISMFWIYLSPLLIFIGQDPVISQQVGKFAICLIPTLFAHATFQPLVRYFQAQSLTFPLLLISLASLCLHLLLCWVFVFKTGLGGLGAAIATDVSMWAYAVFLFLYMRYSSSCEKTSSKLSMDIFKGLREFFRFAIPSAGMVCLEWWSFELVVLLSGLLPNPALETSVLSVCLTTLATFYSLAFGIGAAASTRVSNKLGEGSTQGAQIAVYAVLLMAATLATVTSSILYACRNVFGYVFSNDMEVVNYVTNMAPYICLSIVADSFQGALCGIVRGCGWQKYAAFIVLGSYYLFGIPIAALLGFYFGLRGKGFWIGVLSGCVLQTIVLTIVTTTINWKKQATTTRQRLFEEETSKVQKFIVA